jgi:hypothetical protein
MRPIRPLPTVIGPTENALRALLTKTLSTTSIGNYQAWVSLNAISNAGSGDSNGNWRPQVADALKIEPAALETTFDELAAAGLVSSQGALTTAGAAELATARLLVTATTSQLTQGIGESEQETTRQVLDHIRHQAERFLN